MKIRTDFVTNSSSSSFITIVVNTKDGHCYRAEYDSGDNCMRGDDDFVVDETFFQSVKNCGEILSAMKEWFDGTFSDTSLPQQYDYSEGYFEAIRKVPMSNVRDISIASMIDYEEFAVGSDIYYNYETNEMEVGDTSYGMDDEYDMDDEEYDLY